MARTVTVTLAGCQYEVTELRLRANAEWRKALMALAEDLMTLLEAPDLTFTPGVIAEIVRRVASLLVESPAELLTLLCAYSPEIAEQREGIETDAYDSELMAAFTEVLALAFPFAPLLRTIRSLTSGSIGRPTGRSSRGQSGASGTTS